MGIEFWNVTLIGNTNLKTEKDMDNNFQANLKNLKFV
jgi:hypothetical protein